MTAFSKVDMAEVTRLTRAGRLAEALALIQGRTTAEGLATAGSNSPATANPQAPDLDLAAPDSPEGAWTLAEEPTSDSAFDPGKPASAANRTVGTRRPRDWLAGLAGAVSDRGPVRKRLRRAPVSIPDGARFEERTFTNAAGSRTYKLYVPSRCAGELMPVVVMLHGCTQDPDDFAIGTRMNDVAEEQRFLVVYPRQPQSANVQKCWNWFNPADQRRGSGEPSLIAGIVLKTVAEFSADPGRVYVAGLSAGGAAAVVMAAAYPDLFAAVGVHSGLACGLAFDIPSAFAAMSGKGALGTGSETAIPTIVFHGDGDRTVSLVNADRVIAQARPNQMLSAKVTRGETPAGMPYTCKIEFDGDNRPILEQWTLHGAGHAWSGGSPTGSFTDPRGPDASREMIRFFLRHRSG